MKCKHNIPELVECTRCHIDDSLLDNNVNKDNIEPKSDSYYIRLGMYFELIIESLGPEADAKFTLSRDDVDKIIRCKKISDFIDETISLRHVMEVTNDQ